MITKPKKYTEEYVLGELKTILEELLGDKEIVYKGQLFENKEYTRFRYSEWAKSFSKNREISHTIKKIDEILENRAVLRGFNGKGSPAFLIFHLKNNFGWKDKQELDVNAKVKVDIIDFSELSDNPPDADTEQLET